MSARHADIPVRRLRTHRLAGEAFASVEDAVATQLAVQAQDYLGALWGVGQRVHGADEAMIERALADRRIVRSWPLRGTLHFVAADDLRWLLALAAPRTLQRQKRRLQQDFELDERVVERAREVCRRALGGGRALARDALYAQFDAAGIATAASRGLHLVWWLAHEGTLCFGARAGKQQTFVLLDDWLAPAPAVAREDALAELARRYFASRGPASVQDFAWWSGLAAADAAAAHESVHAELASERIDGVEYWHAAATFVAGEGARVHLLPAWDEYTVAYRERGAFLDAAQAGRAGNGIFKPVLLVDGRIAGTWKRTLAKSGVEVEADWFVEPKAAVRNAFDAAVARYAGFLGLPRIA
ncbi:winged helix DNA-binding domain-containing protein [Dokdonella sp.]|uniref:winged helix DNA-binding domain-containing protein n=1 Tax=Dokdonella sp. TaxID=2291710 RepID=UPI001B102053|nr:winged helix DNA-binding domain-containing protein [Dokdonella sp.]MBO9663848.1 AlkZ family DNA glycosylase [Dokdonella sp.]